MVAITQKKQVWPHVSLPFTSSTASDYSLTHSLTHTNSHTHSSSPQTCGVWVCSSTSFARCPPLSALRHSRPWDKLSKPGSIIRCLLTTAPVWPEWWRHCCRETIGRGRIFLSSWRGEWPAVFFFCFLFCAFCLYVRMSVLKCAY